MFQAAVVDLSPWVTYDFQAAARNSVGLGEPSAPKSGTTPEQQAVPEKVHRGGPVAVRWLFTTTWMKAATSASI
ncbi:contactin-3 [Arapaima gigas]